MSPEPLWDLLKTATKSQERLQICVVPQAKFRACKEQPGRRIPVDLQKQQLTQPWTGPNGTQSKDQITSPQAKIKQNLANIKETKITGGWESIPLRAWNIATGSGVVWSHRVHWTGLNEAPAGCKAEKGTWVWGVKDIWALFAWF